MVAALMIAMIVSACSTAYVDIPPQQFETASRDEPEIHRVTEKSGKVYLVNHFSLTDTTLVIDSLAPNDPRYQRIAQPIVLSRENVASIQRVENGPPSWVVIGAGVLGAAAFIAAIAWLAGGDAFGD